MVALARHKQDLESLSQRSRRRALQPRLGVDFSSNDYLGLAASPALRLAVSDALGRGVPIGSGGSRLLRGNHPEHEALEEEAAEYFGSEAALFFGSGFAANVAVLSALPQRGDLVIHDALVHASAHEGIRLGRAEFVAAPHNDAAAIEKMIEEWHRRGGVGTVWIAVESLYSMDGDRAPLAALAAFAGDTGAMLVVDEAHATGVFGPGGRGLAAELEGRDNVITIRTCGKALGCEGALVCSSRTVRDFLINRARGFIFSTAPSPLLAAGVRASLRILHEEPERQARLHELIRFAEEQLVPLGAERTGSQIMPLLLRDDGRAMAVAAHLQQKGFDVRGIRPPTVPEGTARLRISITLNANEAAITGLAASLREVLQ